MDPNQTYKEIMDELRDGNRGAALDLYADLQAWVRRGGFPPQVDNWRNNILQALAKGVR